jgi:hypothetical protein
MCQCLGPGVLKERVTFILKVDLGDETDTFPKKVEND